MIGGAPEAVAEQEQAAGEQTSPQKDAEEGEEKTQPEQAEAEKPVASVPATNDLWMTIPKLGLYDNYVSNSNAHAALDAGAAKRGAPADVYASLDDGVSLMRNRLVAVRMADGTVFLGYTDMNGHVRIGHAPEGAMRLENPALQPLEPR